ncbi:MAG: GntP family permease [Pirellulales bacterium]|nr:GntP family permease [Pirellulales bacterium]
MIEVHPLLILAIGIATVISMIVVLRINAFIALITAALVVSILAPGEWALKVNRVAEAFGRTAGAIGIVIALAAVIGKAMMDSGAADRVVQFFLKALGEKRSTVAMTGAGFTLSIPVFFDTAFYLLVPLARSLYRNTRKHYLKYLMAITTGGVITHTLVPPTPGPLFIASQLGVDLGLMMLMGIVVGIPSAAVGLFYSRWLDARMPIEMRPFEGEEAETPAAPTSDDKQLPSLALSIAPILLPIVLISINSVVKVKCSADLEADPSLLTGTSVEQSFVHDGKLGALVEEPGKPARIRPLQDGELTTAILVAERLPARSVFQWTNLIGNPNFALLLSAAIAVLTYYRQRRPTREQMSAAIEHALMSGGVIILITSAGGAFGGMLKEAQLGDTIRQIFGDSAVSGLPLLLLAFGVASLIKFAQGSSTSAMIVTSGMIAAMLTPSSLTVNPVYLALAIGSGSLVGSWMNDSGFWIFTKMGVLTEVESLKSWTPLLAIIGVTSMVTVVILALVLPMA